MISESCDKFRLVLRRRAMDLLARREHTRHELSQKLAAGIVRDQQRQQLQQSDKTLQNVDQQSVPESGVAEHLSSDQHDSDYVTGLITDVLNKLEQDNLLSDSRYTESFVSGRINRGYGPLYIRHQLRRKQVDAVLTAEHLQDPDHKSWTEQLTDLIKRRAGKEGMPERGSKAYFKLQRFVLARGFTLTQ